MSEKRWSGRRGLAWSVVAAGVMALGVGVSSSPAFAAAGITAPAAAQAGKPIVISGTGWPSLENVYAYLDQGSTQNYFCSMATDASGNLGPSTCTTPTSLAQGAYSLRVTDTTTTTVTQAFTLNPAAHISMTSGGSTISAAAAGQTVYLSGNGFTASGTISGVTVGGTAVPLTPASPALTTQGGLSGVSFAIPAATPAGTTQVVVTDSSTASASFSVHVYAATLVAPAAGISGRSVTISGAGWPADRTIYTYLNQGATQNYVCSLRTDANGNVGPQNCAVPTSLPQGSYTLSLTNQAVVVNSPFTINPGAHAANSSSGGALGAAADKEVLYLSGTGFTANSTITSTDIGATALTMNPAAPAVSAQGTFSGVTVTVPATTPAGNQTFSVTDSSGQSAAFVLRTYAATDTSGAAGTAGNLFVVQGGGWPANETVYAYLDQGTTTNYMCSVSTDVSGNLGPNSCTVPTNLPKGAYTLSLTDQQLIVNKAFTLNPGAYVAATSSGSSISTAGAGQTVYLTGMGFTSNATLKTVTVGATSVAATPLSAPFSPQGSISGVTFSIPSAAAAGLTKVTVTDSSGKSASFTLEVYRATITAGASGLANRPIAISGGGWPANETVYAYLDQGTTQSYFCSLSTDDSGALGPQTCQMSSGLPQGNYTMYLTDQSVSAQIPFTLNPSLTLLNTSNTQITSAAPGATINLQGYGFSASSTITSVKVGTTTASTSPATPLVTAQGSLSATSFTVPSVAAGTYTVTVTDSSGKSATAPLKVT